MVKYRIGCRNLFQLLSAFIILFGSLFFQNSITKAQGLQSLQKAPLLSQANFEYAEVDSSISGDVKLVGDIDGDDKPDFVVGGMSGENLNWYRYPDWQKTYIATPSIEFTTDGELGDVDGDGDLDAVVANRGAAYGIWLNKTIVTHMPPRAGAAAPQARVSRIAALPPLILKDGRSTVREIAYTVTAQPEGVPPALARRERVYSAKLMDAPALRYTQILSPTDGAYLTSAGPIAITGHSQATDYVRTVTVTVDGGVVYTDNWLVNDTTEADWATAWTPDADTVRDYVISAWVADWQGGVEAEPDTITVTVNSLTTTSQDDLPAGHTPAIVVANVLTPTHGMVLTTLDPIAVTVGASAEADLSVITLTIDSAVSTYVPTTPAIDTEWSSTWTPIAGVHTLIASAEDENGVAGAGEPVTVTVSTTGPTVAFARTTLTTTHSTCGACATLEGTATDSGGVDVVRLQVDGGEWDETPLEAGAWSYNWMFPPSAPPDGETYAVTARVVDGAARTDEATETITVDIVPPSPVSPTIGMLDGAATVPITPGNTIYEANPTLIIDWESGSDGAGVDGYLVGWTDDPTTDPGALTRYPVAGIV